MRSTSLEDFVRLLQAQLCSTCRWFGFSDTCPREINVTGHPWSTVPTALAEPQSNCFESVAGPSKQGCWRLSRRRNLKFCCGDGFTCAQCSDSQREHLPNPSTQQNKGWPNPAYWEGHQKTRARPNLRSETLHGPAWFFPNAVLNQILEFFALVIQHVVLTDCSAAA